MRTVDTEIRLHSVIDWEKVIPPEIDLNWHMTQIVNNSSVVSGLLWLLTPSSLQCLVVGHV